MTARIPSAFGAIAVRPPRAGPYQRIGLMGGSFNPPHEGHVAVARTAMKRLRLDAVWWLVTPGNPLKSNGALPPISARMAACRRLAPERAMVVTDLEARLGSPFTAITLAHLRQRFPTIRFVWLMGADNLAGFHRWRNWRAIAATMPIAVVDRPGWRFKALASPAAHFLARCRWPESRSPRLPEASPPAWVFLTARLSPASSTALRAANSAPRKVAQPT